MQLLFFFITKKWQGCKDEECHRESKSYSHPLSCFFFSFMLCCPLNFVLTFSCSRHFALCSMVWGWKEMTTNVLRDPRGQTVFLLTVPYIKSTEETTVPIWHPWANNPQRLVVGYYGQPMLDSLWPGLKWGREGRQGTGYCDLGPFTHRILKGRCCYQKKRGEGGAEEEQLSRKNKKQKDVHCSSLDKLHYYVIRSLALENLL